MPAKVYIDPTAVIIGNVEIHDGVSIWPYAVLRGDEGRIVVGEGSNVQDQCVLHVGPGFPTIIGKDTTIGHGVIVNGAIIGDRCIIGMNSTVVEGAKIGNECLVGANAVITGGMDIPDRSAVVGVPGKIIRKDDETIGPRALENARNYQHLRDEYLAGNYRRKEFK